MGIGLRRRSLLVISGTSLAAAIAGCSSDDNSADPVGTTDDVDDTPSVSDEDTSSVQGSPEDVVEEFIDGRVNGEIERIEEAVSDDFDPDGSLEKYTFDEDGEVEIGEIEVVEEGEGRASVELEYRLVSPRVDTEVTEDVTVVVEDNEWRIVDVELLDEDEELKYRLIGAEDPDGRDFEPDVTQGRGDRVEDFIQRFDGRTYEITENGDGDFETVEDALAVTRESDVIELGPGTFEVELPTSDTAEVGGLVGSGVEETEVVFLVNREDDRVDAYLSCVNLTFEADPEADESAPPRIVQDCESSSPWSSSGVLDASHSVFTGDRLEVSRLTSEHCRFDGDVDLWHIRQQELMSTRIGGDLRIEDATSAQTPEEVVVDACHIEGHARLEGLSIRITGSHLSTAELDPDSSPTWIRNSEFDGDVTLIDTVNVPSIDVRNTTFRGVVTFDGNGFEVRECLFETAEDWAIDGPGPRRLYHNGFVDCDLRIDEGVTQVFDSEMGNYYSAFERTELKDEFVIDFPREIPGNADLVDQYPLAEPRLPPEE